MEILNENCKHLRVDKNDSGLATFSLLEAGLRMARPGCLFAPGVGMPAAHGEGHHVGDPNLSSIVEIGGEEGELDRRD